MMSHEIRADYNQQWLLPPSLDDLLPADHPARFVREFVDALDLRALGFKMRKGDEGRPSYAPDLLLKVWIYGYLERIRTSRRLERACLHDIALFWLTGMNYPDHNSLWRFWNENRKVLKQVFRQTIQVAAKAGLIGMALHAVDGTKITARASTDKMWGRKQLEKKLAKLDKSLEQMAAEVDRSEKEEAGWENRLPEELADKWKLREEVRAKLAELEKEDRAHMHPKERDAQVVKNHEGTRLGYNAQAVVESEHGLIVAAEVTNEQNDLHQLVPMIDQVKEAFGVVAGETLADSGYWNGAQLSGAEEKGYPVLVNLDAADGRYRGGDYDASKFTYDKQRDCCVCPRGQELKYERTRRPDGKPHPRVYRCSGYQECPVRWQCSKDKQGRRVEISPYHDSFLRQREKQSDSEKKWLLRQRMRIAEPVFAVIKERLGFRRWTVGGLEKVQAQWEFLAGLVNLVRLYAIWREGELELI
jgi:transposase